MASLSGGKCGAIFGDDDYLPLDKFSVGLDRGVSSEEGTFTLCFWVYLLKCSKPGILIRQVLNLSDHIALPKLLNPVLVWCGTMWFYHICSFPILNSGIRKSTSSLKFITRLKNLSNVCSIVHNLAGACLAFFITVAVLELNLIRYIPPTTKMFYPGCCMM